MSCLSTGQIPCEVLVTLSSGVDRLVLGVNIGFHDSSAALLRGGALLRLVEQEKVGRRKHALAQPPAQAVAACLAAERVSPESIDAVAIGWDYGLIGLGGHRRFQPEGLRAMLFPESAGFPMPPVRWVPHHLAHAASGYYGCGADEAAILVIDGAGETQCTTIARGRGGEIDVLREWPISQSLGFFYAAASKWAGFSEWGAGKLMGLAAYGRPRPGMPLHASDGGYELVVDDGDGVSERPAPREGRRSRMPLMSFDRAYEAAVAAAFGCHFPYAERRGEEAIAYADFAATVQHQLEDAVLGLVTEARRLVDVPTLVLAGGVGMNCSMIGRLLREGPFDRVVVPPVPTDVGVSLGAGLVEARRSGGFSPVSVDHAFWSVDLDGNDAAEAVRSAGLASRPADDDDIARTVAGVIAAGGIVGWARGRGEIGQRALGARSILADPRDRRILERLNVLKGREMWRPVAPSVLAEHIGEVMATPVGEPARFMLAAGTVRPEVRTRMPATTHVDGSARPQLVERATNPTYWSAISRFRDLTGVPAVVNTSFNLAGEPIVSSAEDAVSTFLRAKDLDLMVLGQLLVTRSQADLPAPP